MSGPPQSLGDNRYQCLGCGSCCFGHAIGLIDEAEAERIRDAGARLGVPDPVVDGQLRYEDHRCVFHDDDRLCRIHKELGAEVKPLRCQLWPLKVVRADEGLRFGVDPGCLNLWRTWRTGPSQEPAERMVVRPSATSPAEARVERQLLALACAEQATVAGIWSVLAGEGDLAAPTLSTEVASRIAIRARAIRMGQLLAKPALGPGLVEPLAHLPAFLDQLDPAAPPPSQLHGEQDAFAREVVRRKLWLREAPVAPAAHGLAVLSLMGAVVCHWADPRPEVFGPALSAWTRLMRFQAFWLRIAPEMEILRWLCTGHYDGEHSPDMVVGG
jgi:Fe-S-cluster containining protein